jgi:c(7)-type cytochrome triheme protein
MTARKLVPMLAAALLGSAAHLHAARAQGQPDKAAPERGGSGGRSLIATPSKNDLPRLPKPLQLAQSKDSPGLVKFDHGSHVDYAKPACASCHPRLFGILGRSAQARQERMITHATMEKGAACGACHGKAAFNFDDCTMCHAM